MAPTSPQGTRPLRRTALAAAVAGVLAAAPTAAPLIPAAYAKHDPLRHRQQQVRHDVTHARGDLEESSRGLRRAQQRLAAAQDRLRAAQHTLAGTRQQLAAAQATDARMQQALAAAQHQLAAAQDAAVQAKAHVRDQLDAIAAMALDNYQAGDPALVGLVAVLGGEDPSAMTTQLNAVHGVMTHQSDTLHHLQDVRVELVRREAAVAQARTRVAGQRAAAASNLAHTRTIASAAATQEHTVAALVASRRSAARRAAHIRAHDRAQLRRLQRQEARIKRRILARARHQHNRVVASTSGLLQRPVSGYITSPYGWRIHPIYHYWGLHDGVDFGGGCGTPLRSAAPGRVVASYWSDVYGHRLVIDNGAMAGVGIATIYNHATSYTVGVGDQVQEGQVIGYEGSTGWSTGCHLHFTVMANGKAVDPMNWF